MLIVAICMMQLLFGGYLSRNYNVQELSAPTSSLLSGTNSKEKNKGRINRWEN